MEPQFRSFVSSFGDVAVGGGGPLGVDFAFSGPHFPYYGSISRIFVKNDQLFRFLAIGLLGLLGLDQIVRMC